MARSVASSSSASRSMRSRCRRGVGPRVEQFLTQARVLADELVEGQARLRLLQCSITGRRPV